MNTATAIKPWYKIAGVEYSTDFNFFIENQIAVGKTNGIHCTLFSRLNGQMFNKLTLINSIGIESNPDITDECKKIHTKLLKGEFGQGEFID